MAKFGVKEVADVTFYSLSGTNAGHPVLYLDTLKLSDVENTAESASARGGKGNPKLLTWDYNREAMMNVQDALMTTKSLAMLAGTDLAVADGSTTTHNAHLREELTLVSDGASTPTYTLTLTKTPVDTTAVYMIDANGNDISADFSVSGTTATYNGTDLAEGAVVATYYKYTLATASEKISIDSDAFPGYYKIVGDTVIRNAETGADESFQITIHRAKLQPGFTLSFQAEGEPSVFDMNLEVFPDSNKSMIELLKY